MKPKQEKQIQIPLRLLEDLEIALEALFTLSKDKLNYDDIKHVKGLQSEISGKFERMERHNTFTQYKTAPPESERREHYRAKYLDEAGMNPDWISKSEVFNP